MLNRTARLLPPRQKDIGQFQTDLGEDNPKVGGYLGSKERLKEKELGVKYSTT